MAMIRPTHRSHRLAAILLLLRLSSVDGLFLVLPRFGCFLRFLLFRFNIEKFDQYPRYFHDDSVMILAQTGTYKGDDAIEEYARFVHPSGGIFKTWKALDEVRKFNGYDRKNKICSFSVMYDNEYTMNPSLSAFDGSEKIRVANFVTLEFHQRKRYIPAIYVHYTESYLGVLFNTILNSDNTRNYVCDIYEQGCASVLEKPEDCTGELQALAESYNGTYLDGNSQGCRVLHSSFAATNNEHCAHLSFEPMEDSSGAIKCQESEGMTTDMFFSDSQLSRFKDFMAERGLDPEVGYTIDA